MSRKTNRLRVRLDAVLRALAGRERDGADRVAALERENARLKQRVADLENHIAADPLTCFKRVLREGPPAHAYRDTKAYSIEFSPERILMGMSYSAFGRPREVHGQIAALARQLVRTVEKELLEAMQSVKLPPWCGQPR